MGWRKAERVASADGVVPGYAGLTEIGGGGLATVYRAVEEETGRSVALKILKMDTIRAHLIEAFQEEIQALARVSDHPNIVTLYRPATTTDGRPVLVLELCRESLAARLRSEGAMTAPDVARVGVKIAGALESAHRNGFLHRDMKPENILVTTFGEPALADFGVAALHASAQATFGPFGFSTFHVAPEVLEGHDLSPATDVYGLASTLYQLLAGSPPFDPYQNEPPASVILRILRDPVPPLRAEGVPLPLVDLLSAALSKEPEGRPRTAGEFATALQEVERSAGWPVTEFAPWGADGANPGDLPGSPGPGVSAGPPGTPGALGETGPSMEPTVRAGGPSPFGGELPPLLPAAPPPVAAAPPAVAAAPPKSARRGPSLVRPEPAVRRVVSPPSGRRGQPRGNPADRGEPLDPLGGDDPGGTDLSGTATPVTAPSGADSSGTAPFGIDLSVGPAGTSLPAYADPLPAPPLPPSGIGRPMPSQLDALTGDGPGEEFVPGPVPIYVIAGLVVALAVFFSAIVVLIAGV